MAKSVVYGPVPSRRLGRSLGVDLVPYKICSYDCIYCQIGRTPQPTSERKSWVPADKAVSEVLQKLDTGVAADYITLGGSGEPTLNSEIGKIIRQLKEATQIPVTVLTNGSMLMFPEVREEVAAADVVLPSFDACTEEMFSGINRPCPQIRFQEMAEGLVDFRKDYGGRIWLEIFLVEGINTSDTAVEAFSAWMERIGPDKIHLNTAVRPTAESNVLRPSDDTLIQVRDKMGERAEIVVPYQGDVSGTGREGLQEDLIDLLSRRPCTLSDIAQGLDTHQHEILKYLEPLVDSGEIERVQSGGATYYQRTP
ncbi:MAG: radical SAM protein [Desulfobacterales bacterium]|nr:radical SAM protein [Desulfobacterales bacterium]